MSVLKIKIKKTREQKEKNKFKKQIHNLELSYLSKYNQIEKNKNNKRKNKFFLIRFWE